MAEIQTDLTITRIDLTELEGDVNFLFDEQVIQDERIFQLETETEGIEEEVEGLWILSHSRQFFKKNITVGLFSKVKMKYCVKLSVTANVDFYGCFNVETHDLFFEYELRNI